MIEQTEVMDAAAQLDWLAGASARLPLTEEEIRGHAAPALLDASGGAAGVNAVLGMLGRIAVSRVVAARPDQVQAVIRSGGRDQLLRMRVDGAGLVDNLDLSPDEAVPGSWTELDGRLGALGARVSFAAAEIGPDGSCRVVHGLDADTLRPIGSSFKLYVLGALAQAVAEGRAAWDEPLALREDWRSPFARDLEDRPDGTALTLAEYADSMISVSDNTATDHLIHRLGRDAVGRQFPLFGHHRPEANDPLLSTKAFFALKLDPDRARDYLARPRPERAAAVGELERVPLSGPRPIWPQPREIDQVEWFASAADVCRAYAGLLRQDQPEIGHALSIAAEGLNLDESRFPAVWFKPGREPGVMALTYLARTAQGRALAVSLLVSDPAAAFDLDDSTVQAQSVIRDAFSLLAAS